MPDMIQTVTGPISRENLGKMLVHEHFVFGFPGYQGDVTFGGFDKDSYLEELTELLGPLKEAGLKTIIDATPNECGRDPAFLREISLLTGIQIICATGYYYEGSGSPLYFKMRQSGGSDVVGEIYEILRHELNVSIGGTGVRAGVIKLGTSRGEMTQYEELFFRAACRLAAEDRNVRIITHTEGGTCANIQADYFLEHGVLPEQVAIGHVDGCTDMDELMSVLEKGFYASFDRLGMNGFFGTPMDSRKLACIYGLLGCGYGGRILLSHDKVFRDLGRAPKWPDAVASIVENWNWRYIFETFLPKLEEMGVSKQQCEKFITANPANFLFGN